MADNNLEILIVQAMLDKTISTENIKKDLAEISKLIGSLKLSVNIDNTEFTKLANSLEVITKNISSKKIEVFDESQLQKGQKLYANLQDVKNEYSKIGQIKVTNETLNPITKELQGFTLAVTNADNKVEKLKFDLINIAKGNSINQMFTPTKLTQTDPIATNLQNIEKLKVAEMNAIHEEANVENQARNEMEQAFKTMYANREKESAMFAANQAKFIYENSEKEREENTKTQNQIENNIKKATAAKEDALIKLKDLQRRYGNSLDGSQANSIQQSIQQINPVSEDAPDKIKQVNTQLKELSANAATARSNMMSFSEQFGEAVKKFPIWIAVSTLVMGSIHLLESGLQGIVDIESKMAGYVQTNETFFDSQVKINEASSQFIQTTHALGAEINDVLESARLYGRMYKDVAVVQELVSQATKLSTVDLVSLGDATKGMEAILAQYHVQLTNVNEAQVVGNQLLDSFSKVAHDSAIPASELLAAYGRMGSVAHDTGVSVDFMNGLLASGFRNTALSGENLGNMWKTVLGNLHSDAAVAELTKLNVATKETVDGVEQWRKAEDVLLDLSVKVIGQNGDLTKSYEDIARGVFQYQKLAASIDLGSIIQAQAASINSTGSTTELLKTQLDTISKKSSQVKASFLDLFNTAGNDGLRNAMKDILDVTDQLLMGVSKIPTGVFATIGSITTLGLAYMAFKNPITNVIASIKTLNASRLAITSSTVAETVAVTGNVAATEKVIVSSNGAVLAKVSETAAVETTTVAITAEAAAAARATVTTALWTGGISLAVGLLAVYALNLGSAKKKEEDLTAARDKAISIQEQEYEQIGKQIDVIPKWISVHNDLIKSIDSEKLSSDGLSKAKTDLAKVSQALTDTLKTEGITQNTTATITDDATRTIVDSLKKRQAAVNQTISDNLDLQATENENAQAAAEKKLDQAKKHPSSNPFQGGMSDLLSGLNPFGHSKSITEMQKDTVDSAQKDLDDLKTQATAIEQKKIDIQNTMLQPELDAASAKALAASQSEDEAKTTLQDKLTDFNHFVAIQAKGYTDANDQITKLIAIKNSVKNNLTAADMYNIDEQIYKLQHPDKTDKGSTTPSQQADIENNPYQRNSKIIEGALKASESAMTHYNSTSVEYRAELQKQYELQIKQRDLEHIEAERIRGVNVELQKQLGNQKLDAETRKQINKQIEDNLNTITDLGEKWQTDNLNADQLLKDKSDSLVQGVLDNQNTLMDSTNAKIKALKTSISSLETDPADKIKDQGELLSTYGAAQDQIINNVTALEALNKTLDVNSEAFKNNKAAIENDKEAYAQNEADAQALRESMANDVIDLMKKGVQTQQQDEIDAENRRHDTKTKNLQDEYDKAISYIDRLQATNDYNANLSKDDQKQQDIQNQINAYSLDTSNEGKSKVADLNKQLADIKEKIANETQTRQNDIVKQGLEDQNKIAKDAEDKQNQTTLDGINDKYTTMLNDDAYWLGLEKDLIEGHTTEVNDQMKGLIDNLDKYATDNVNTVGVHVASLQSMINQLKGASAEIGNLSTQPSNNTGTGANSSNDSTGTVLTPAQKIAKAQIDDAYAASELARAKNVYDADKAAGNMTGANAAHAYAEQLRVVNSTLPKYITGGLNTQGGLAQLDGTASKPELVLNALDTSNILKVVDFTRDLMSKITSMKPDFSQLIPKNIQNAANNTTINMYNTFTGDKSGIDSSIKALNNAARRLGVVINHS